jgi:hypothetical protein
MTTLRKPRGRPFQPGNPGRPVGSKNRTTQIATTNQGRRRSAEHGEASHNSHERTHPRGTRRRRLVLAPFPFQGFDCASHSSLADARYRIIKTMERAMLLKQLPA